MHERKVFSEHEIKKENTLDDEETKMGITGHKICHTETDWCSGKTPDLYLQVTWFKSWLGHSPVPPGKFQDSILIRL